MRLFLILIGLLVVSTGQLIAQRACYTSDYQQTELTSNNLLASEISRIESFIQQQLNRQATSGARLQQMVVRIPVVVHILYHQPSENISNQQVMSQIEMLNKCFRRTHEDSAKTPARFKPFAADCEIEFQLATSDPGKRNTTGILRKYTPVVEWEANDQIKFSAQTGDDAWDAANYLNIWVGNIKRIAGYSSSPGGDPQKDGIVLDYSVFGQNTTSGYDMGKTAVHEAGHWLGLKHMWGDAYCGDDLVDDTPKQGNYTTGCPSGIRSSCNNGPDGDMYMNYMDYCYDACINLFTEGQKSRMRTLFAPGGPRYTLLSSYGLNPPLINESPLPEETPKWVHPHIYPNPASNELVVDVAYDIRWIGKTITMFNVNGQVVMNVTIISKVQVIDITNLKQGMYFMAAKKEDGAVIRHKFVKASP